MRSSYNYHGHGHEEKLSRTESAFEADGRSHPESRKKYSEPLSLSLEVSRLA